MSKKVLVAAVVLAVGIALVGAAQDKNSAPKSAAQADPDFTGKVLYVWFKDPAKTTLLHKARVQWLGGRAFLVGQWAPRMEGEDRRDEIYWYPVDELVTLVEYKNLAAAQKAIEAARNQK